MSIHVSCPACKMTLNVPDHLLGKRVKCPECATPFDAQPAGAAPPSAPAAPSLVPPAPTDLPPPVSTPVRQTSPAPELWDDSPHRGDEAHSLVQAPAIFLMVLGILGVLGWTLLGLLFLLGFASQPNRKADDVVALVILSGMCFVSVLAHGFAIYGANEMRRLGSYGWSMAGCIVGIVAGMFSCCLPMPFAIWGLVVINDPRVQEAFHSRRER